ncbi:MAG: tetratricopeptide repeat protein [Myxococcales bacterium]|nr:tetratricopeptide repeat protein [Myxococcales bacterium]
MNRNMTDRLFAFALSVSLVGVASSARAAEVCIAASAEKELSTCPNKTAGSFDVGKHGKKPDVTFRTAPPPQDLKKRDQVKKPPSPSEQMTAAQRDERASKLKQRQRALLVTEIQGLENLFKTTAKNAADRPDIARRLAETYVELVGAANREKIEAEIKRDSLKKSNPAEAGKQQATANQANAILNSARTKVQFYYSVIKNEYPNYRALDKVLYYLAYEYEQQNDNANARKVYLELINKRPDSKYIPNAYLAFGELFFNEAQGDPSKWDLAQQAYTEVLKFPPEKNKVFGYAWYKIGYVFWNKGEFDKSLNAFKKVIEWGNGYKDQPGASKLADAARKDTIPVYALKGDPRAAYNFFKGISGDAGGSNEKTFNMMDQLGMNYLDTGHYPEAIELYKDLMTRDRGSARMCSYQAHITEATMALKSSNKDVIRGELDAQVKNYNEFKSSGHPADAKQECANKTAALLAETGMAWHLEAVGSQGQRGTGDQKTMTLAAYTYKKIVDTWDAKTFASFQFPRIVKEDWPTIYKVKYAMADLLYFQQKWAECGPAFDSVVEEDPNSSEAAEAAFASVLCYQNIYDATHKGGEDKKGMGNLPGQGKKTEDQKKAEENAKLQPKQLTASQKGMVTAFNRYICYIKPPASDNQGQEQLVEVKYARARTYFEAQRWDEAGLAFKEIAMNHADRDVGIYAAQLYLESINVLGSNMNPPRPQCYDDMAGDVPKFIELYCQGEKATKNQEQCVIMKRIQADIRRLQAQKLVEKADKGGASALQDYEKAGGLYLELYRNNCEAPVREGKPPTAEKCDELVYNAARAFQAGRLIAKAIAARMILLNPQNKMEKSDLARKAMYEIGGNYQAIAVYDQAAEWYEKYAKEFPKGDKADQALSDAVILRLGLGDEQKAIEDEGTFRRNYGGTKPAQTAAISFAIGAHYAEKEQWEKAKTTLQGAMGVISKAAPDIQVQAHATLGHSLSNIKGQQGAAGAEYAKVRALWTDPAGAVKKIAEAYPGEDEGAKQRRLGKALNAVGEAIFFAAEEKRKADVETIKFPAYKGAGTKDDVLKHVQTKVKAWLEKKRPAIEKVEADYKKIVELQPEPPPKWVIAAGSRVGLMWGGFVDEFRAAPIPEAWKKDDEIRNTYFSNLDQASEPIKVQRAKPALVTCLSYSVKYQYFDGFSRDCEVWLAKNYKSEYKVVDEIRSAPTLSNSGLDDRSPPLNLGGQLFHGRDENAKPTEKAGSASSDEKDPKPAAGKPAAAKPAAAPPPKPKGGGKGGGLPGKKK